MTYTNKTDFIISEYIEFLEPSETKRNKYFCPVCGDDNLEIARDGEKFNCFSNECDTKQITKLICEKAGKGYDKTAKRKSLPAPPKPEPAPIPKELKLSTVNYELKPKAKKEEGNSFTINFIRNNKNLNILPDGKITDVVKTTYPYLHGNCVERLDFYVNGEKKKLFIPKSLNHKGELKVGKNGDYWEAYRLSDAIKAVRDLNIKGTNAILGLEGEKAAEIAWLHNIPSFSFQGSSSEKEKIKLLEKAKKSYPELAIIYLADNDKPGIEKGKKLAEVCHKLQIPIVVINVHQIVSGLKIGADIEEVLEVMNADNLVEEINAILNKDNTKDTQDKNPYEILTTVEQTGFETIFESGKGNWCVINDAFYKYTSMGYWRNIPDSEIEKLIALELQNFYTTKVVKINEEETQKIKVFKYATETHKKNCFKYCKSALTATNSELKTNNEHLICFRNGTLDIRTGQLLGHDKSHFLTSSIDSGYIPNSPCPEIYKKFIADVHGEEFEPLIRALISMYCDPSTPYGYFAHFVGASGSGKGTQISLFGSFFNNNCKRSLNSLNDVATPEKRHQNLTGSRFVSFPDMGGRLTTLEPFYELVDNGSLGGRALFSSHGYEKFWNCRFIMASVSLLALEHSGGGWDRRCIPVPTKERKGEQDFLLKNKLQEVKAEILSWALAMDRNERDKTLKNATKIEAIANLKIEQAILSDNVRAFINSCLRPSEDGQQMEVSQMYDYYRAFCKAQGYTPQAQARFSSHMKNQLAKHWIEKRSKTKDETGKRINIPKRFTHIKLVNPAIFGNRIHEFTGEIIWTCNNRACIEGGLEEFEEFWKNPENLSQPVSPVSPSVSSVSPTLRQHQSFTQQAFTDSVSPVSPVSPYFKDFENCKKEGGVDNLNFYNLQGLGETGETGETGRQNPCYTNDSGCLTSLETGEMEVRQVRQQWSEQQPNFPPQVRPKAQDSVVWTHPILTIVQAYYYRTSLTVGAKEGKITNAVQFKEWLATCGLTLTLFEENIRSKIEDQDLINKIDDWVRVLAV